MVEEYKIIYGDKDIVHEDEIVEQKSRFIAYIKKVVDEKEATAFIQEVKKKHYDASHNCSAFILGTRKELVRCNDDGEPSGTAGKPILDVLMGSDLVNIVCVVTRYFGGKLLGKGGLSRAYSDAAKECLEKLPVARMCLGKRLRIDTDYNTIGKILHELSQQNLTQEHSEYTDVISLTVIIPIEIEKEFIKSITDISAGKSQVEVVEEVYFEKREL